MPPLLIELHEITCRHGNNAPVLRQLSLSLAAGERVSVGGAIGSGKTTLLHCIVGLVRPEAGEVRVFGQARRLEKDFAPVRSRVGLLFQEPDDQLFCPTLEEDVAFGPMNLGRAMPEALDMARRTLERVGLGGMERRMPHTLSGGEKRLAALAGLLAMEPEVLLLDEPTNDLDAVARERIKRIISDWPGACLVVSHDEAFAGALAHRRLILEGGRVREAS